MIKLFVQYYSPSLAALQGRIKQQNEAVEWEFIFGETSNIHVRLRDHLKEVDGIKLHFGLLITISLQADSVDLGLEMAKDISETLLNSVTYASLAFCGPAQLIGYVDITSNKIRSLGYPFNNTSNPLGSLALLQQATFDEIFYKYNQVDEKNRLMRSMSWLRKGVNERDVIDEFVSYWVGLEVLRGLLRRRLKMKTRDPSEWQPIQAIFNNLGGVEFEDVLNARNALLHGFRELNSEFVEEITSYVHSIRNALIMAIGEVLTLDKGSVSVILGKPLRRQRMENWIAPEADFQNPNNLSAQSLMSNFPHVTPFITGTKFAIEKSGDLNVGFQVTHKFVGPDDIKWGNIAFEHWGDPDTGITGAAIKLD